MKHRTQLKINIKKRKRGQKGISLLEIMIAIFIMSISLLALARIQSLSMHFTNSTQKKAVAMLIAQTNMETLLSKTYTDLSTYTPSPLTQKIDGTTCTTTSTINSNPTEITSNAVKILLTTQCEGVKISYEALKSIEVKGANE